MTSPERIWATMQAVQHVVRSEVQGSFVECGAWRGGSSMAAALQFLIENESRELRVFDTFAGMTRPDDVDGRNGEPAIDEWAKNQTQTHNEWCYASLEDVTKNLRSTGYPANLIRLIKGDVTMTLARPENLPEKIAILRLDTDWYASTKVELEALYPRLSLGGVLIVDDYGWWDGARRAVDEFFANRPRPMLTYTDITGRMGVKLK
ncbi:TylF/MycF/NovP-related O-methyltransferase [Bradyrhizobium sp. 33ap4]|uniref:TylF/MycF/NovP-related O-methyltransferase n=1 Tax=Bradyrhizobium sp. 33ap4 TaxID=3061630 RepID=UPI00292FB34D|nr:TylF/MycF/NovP-related O-methyltransferase [Bradyrhizobium sp. 33ap4]